MAKIEVGKSYSDTYGNVNHCITEIPKSNWKTDYSLNYSVSKVFGCLFNGTKIQVAHHNKTKSFNKFISECKKSMKLSNFIMKEGDFDEMVTYGYESEDGKTGKNIHFTNGLCEFTTYGVEVCIVPWHDGVMLQSIVVPKENRNNGYGHQIMRELDLISIKLEIPIYLIAYPGENHNPSDEKVLVSKLEKFYSRLDYDLALEHGSKIWPKVLCNFE